jgi:hypothetical protein
MVGANGIIAALDPGKYGPINIYGPVTINGNGWAAITAPAGGAAITISGSGDVYLTGLEIDGAGAGYYGILYNLYFFNYNLIVNNCLIQNMVESSGGYDGSGSGLAVLANGNASANITVTNTTFAYNGRAGIYYDGPTTFPNLNFIIDHVMATANGSGIDIDAANSTGGSVRVAVSNSVLDNNGTGIVLSGGLPTMEAMVSDSHIDSNTTAGVQVGSASTIIRNVTINQTPIGVDVGSGGTAYFSQTTITNIVGFPLTAGVLLQGGTAESDGTSHLTPVSGGLLLLRVRAAEDGPSRHLMRRSDMSKVG